MRTEALPCLLLDESSGKGMRVDPCAPLENGCRVAVFWDVRFVLSGRLLRRPHPRWRLVIEYTTPDGLKGVDRTYGLMSDDTKVYRVVGIGTFTHLQ